MLPRDHRRERPHRDRVELLINDDIKRKSRGRKVSGPGRPGEVEESDLLIEGKE